MYKQATCTRCPCRHAIGESKGRGSQTKRATKSTSHPAPHSKAKPLPIALTPLARSYLSLQQVRQWLFGIQHQPLQRCLPPTPIAKPCLVALAPLAHSHLSLQQVR